MGKNKQYENAASIYQQYASQNTGEAGYNKSLQLAQQGANSYANAAQSQIQTAARNAGMSKGAAAMMGQNSMANAYNNMFNQQQQMAQSSLDSQLNAQGNLMSSRQAEANNIHNRAWGNASNTMALVGQGVKTAAALSDERLKHYRDISSSLSVSDEELKIAADKNKEKTSDKLKKVGDAITPEEAYGKVESSVAEYKNVSDERLKSYYDITNEWKTVSSEELKEPVKTVTSREDRIK